MINIQLSTTYGELGARSTNHGELHVDHGEDIYGIEYKLKQVSAKGSKGDEKVNERLRVYPDENTSGHLFYCR